MEDTEKLLDKIGSKGKYQYILCLLFFIEGLGHDFTTIFLTLQLGYPTGYYVDIKGNKVIGVVDNEFCVLANGKNNITINSVLSIHNWSYIYELHCEKLKTMILSNSLFLGFIIGTLLLTVLNKIRKELLFKIFTLTYCLSINLQYINNYYVLVTMNLLLAITHICSFILRISIISELTDKNNRSYFIGFQILTGIFIGIISGYLYHSGIMFEYIYSAVNGLIFIDFLIIIFYLKTNPRWLLLNNYLIEAIDNATYIANINGLIYNDYKVEEVEHYREQDILKKKEINVQSKIGLEQWIRNNYDYLIDTQTNNIKSNKKSDYIAIRDNINYIKDEDNNSNYNERLNIEVDSYKYNRSIFENSVEYALNLTEIKNLVLMTMLNISFHIVLYLNVFEIIFYENKNNIDNNDIKKNYQKSFNLWFTISMILSFFLIILNGYLMNTMLGRKGTIILSLCLCLITRLFGLAIGKIPLELYFIERAISNSTQVPMSTLLMENFNNIKRLKFYSIVSLCALLLTCSVPVFLNYLDIKIVNWLYSVFCFLSIAFTIFTRETKNRPLRDK